MSDIKLLMENWREFSESKEEVEETELNEVELDEAELDEAALCHDPDTGHFADCEAGAVYSLSQRGAAAAGIKNDKLVARGVLTSDEPKEDGSYSVRAPFGLNVGKNQGGRINMPSGEPKSPQRYVKGWNRRYPWARYRIKIRK